MATALRLMAEYQLARGDHRAAAVLISEMAEAPPELQQRLAELKQRAKAAALDAAEDCAMSPLPPAPVPC